MPDARKIWLYESVCGPWFPGDLPSDVLWDIQAVDPETDVTLDDCAAYLDRGSSDGE